MRSFASSFAHILSYGLSTHKRRRVEEEPNISVSGVDKPTHPLTPRQTTLDGDSQVQQVTGCAIGDHVQAPLDKENVMPFAGPVSFDGYGWPPVSCTSLPPLHDAAASSAGGVVVESQQFMDWDQHQAPGHLHLRQQPQLQQMHLAGRDISQVPRLPPLATRGGSLVSRGAAGTALQGVGGGAAPFKRPLEDSSNGAGEGGGAFNTSFQRSGINSDAADRLTTAPSTTGRHLLGVGQADGRAPLRPRNGGEPAGNASYDGRAAVPPRYRVSVQLQQQQQQQQTAADPHQLPQQQLQQHQQHQQHEQAPLSRQLYTCGDGGGLAPQPSSTWLPPVTCMPTAVPGSAANLQRQWQWQQQQPQPAAASRALSLTPMAGGGSAPPARAVSAESFLEAVASCPELHRVLAWLLRRRLLPVPGDLVGTLAHMYLLCRRAVEGAAGAVGAASAPTSVPAAAAGSGLDVAARLRDADWLLTLLWVVESVSSQYRCQLAAEVLPSYLEAMAAAGGTAAAGAAGGAGGGCLLPAWRPQQSGGEDGSSSEDDEQQGPGCGGSGENDNSNDSDIEYDGSCTVRRERSPEPPLPPSLEVVCGRTARWWRRRMVRNQLQLLQVTDWRVTVSSQQLAAATEELVTAERQPPAPPAAAVATAASIAAVNAAPASYCTPPPPPAARAAPDGTPAVDHLLTGGGEAAMLVSSSSSQPRSSRPVGLARWFSSSAAVAPMPPAADAAAAPPPSMASSGRPLTATRFPTASGLLGGSSGAVSGRSITEPGCGRQGVPMQQLGLLPSLCRALSVPSPLLAGFRRNSRSSSGGGSSRDVGSDAGRAAPQRSSLYGAAGPVSSGVHVLLLPLVSRLVEQAAWNPVPQPTAAPANQGPVAGPAGGRAPMASAAGAAAALTSSGADRRRMVGPAGATVGGQQQQPLRARLPAERPVAGGERLRRGCEQEYVYAYAYEESLQEQLAQQQAEQCAAAANVWAC